MSTTETIAWLALMLLGIGASACFSGVEVGCYSLNRLRLNLRARRTPPDYAARMLHAEIDKPDRLLSTLLIGNNAVNYLAALAVTALLESTGRGPGWIAAVNTLLLTPMVFVLGEAVPKELFRVEADRLTYLFAPPLSALRWLLTVTGVLPLVSGVIRLTEKLAKLKREDISDARQRIAMLISEGAGSGALSESQTTLVDRALVLKRVRVGDEMVPWSKVRSIPADAGAAAAIRIIGPRSHARVPVLDRAGRVAGFVRQVDLHTRAHEPLSALLTPPVKLTRQMPVLEGLLMLWQSRSGVGVVEDAAGRPVGLVTARDLVEPLTGELSDL